MSTFAKIQIVLAIIFVIFECVIIQLCHTATSDSYQTTYPIIGLGGFFTYLAIILVTLVIKMIVEMVKNGELKEKFLNTIYTICFVAVLVFVYQFVYQILIVLGVDQKTAGEWPIIVFFGIIAILSVVVCIFGDRK